MNQPSERIRPQGMAILTDTVFLYALQAMNMVVPILYLPHLARLLGPSDFGTLMTALAMATYGCSLVEYGYALVGSRFVALNVSNSVALNRYIVASVLTRFILFCPVMLIALVCAACFVSADGAVTLTLIAMLMPLGSVLLMNWVYQGIGQLPFASLTTLLVRLLLSIPLFVMNSGPQALLWSALFVASPTLIASVIMLVDLRRRGYVDAFGSDLTSVKVHLRDGKSVFVATIATGLYTQGASIMLGIFSATSAVGIYAVGEKIRNAIVALIGPISQILYPRINQQLAKQQSAQLYLKAALLVQVGGVAAICLVLFVFMPEIVARLFSSAYLGAVPVARILVMTPALIALDNVLGVLYMMPRGMDAALKRVHLTIAVLALPAFIICSHRFGTIGIASAVLAASSLTPGLMLLIIIRQRRR
jgi:O-antigen/teichoic acid export membrane protein